MVAWHAYLQPALPDAAEMIWFQITVALDALQSQHLAQTAREASWQFHLTLATQATQPC